MLPDTYVHSSAVAASCEMGFPETKDLQFHILLRHSATAASGIITPPTGIKVRTVRPVLAMTITSDPDKVGIRGVFPTHHACEQRMVKGEQSTLTILHTSAGLNSVTSICMELLFAEMLEWPTRGVELRMGRCR